jgi:hypothetical protein
MLLKVIFAGWNQPRVSMLIRGLSCVGGQTLQKGNGSPISPASHISG